MVDFSAENNRCAWTEFQDMTLRLILCNDAMMTFYLLLINIEKGVWNKMYNAIINPTALNTPTNLYNWMIRHDSDINFDLYKELM